MAGRGCPQDVQRSLEHSCQVVRTGYISYDDFSLGGGEMALVEMNAMFTWDRCMHTECLSYVYL